MTKGQLKEIIQSAIYLKKVSNYSVKYREMNEYVIKTLQEFLETSDEYAGLAEHAIPYHRIIEIYENDKLIFSRRRK